MLSMRHSSSGRPGRWFLGLLMPMLSLASGCTPSSTILMAPSLATRRVSWPMAFLKHMVLTIMRHSRLWRASAPSVSSSPSLWISPSRFISWTCPTPSFTETSMRRYSWSNDVSFLCVVKHKDDGQTKFIKPNSQRQDIIIKYWVSIGSIHREQG